MGGGGTEQTTTTSAPANPAVEATTTKLLTNLQGQIDRGSSVYGQTLNPGAGQTTQNAWASSLSAANNPAYSQGVAGATSDFADAAAGNQYGANDAYYDKLGDKALTDVGAMFTNSGRFGSNSHVKTAVGALGDVNNANIAADRAWQMQAAGALPTLYQAGMAPSAAMGAIGAEQDANALTMRQGEADLFNRQNNRGMNDLSWASSVLAGTAPSGGTTQTTTQPATPWWQSMLGAGAIGSGIYKTVWGK